MNRTEQLEAYIKDHYGSCSLGPRCVCLDPKHPNHLGWLGTACRNWTPLPAKNWRELVDIFRAHR